MAQFPSALARRLTRIVASLVVGILAAVMLLYSLSKAAPPTSGEASPKASPSNTSAFATSFITVEGSQFKLNGQPFKMRGVNYYAKDYSWDHFWISYTQAITDIEHELCLMEGLGVNALRIFLRWKAFAKEGVNNPEVRPERIDNLKDFIGRADGHDMKVLITLFDGIPTSGTHSIYQPISSPIAITHLSTLVPTFTNDTRIIGWDIKNEPDRDYYRDANGDGKCGEDLYWADPDDKAAVQGWISRMISEVKTLDPNHLVTVGPYAAVIITPTTPKWECYTEKEITTDTLVFSPTIVNYYSQVITNPVDFVSVHYSLPEEDFQCNLGQVFTGGKPLVLEEFALHTDADHSTDKHTEADQEVYYNALLSMAGAENLVGVLFWTLVDFTDAPPGMDHRNQHQGILRNRNITTTEKLSPTNYAWKPAAYVVQQHYRPHLQQCYRPAVRYLDLFNGHVNKSERPPPGWSVNDDEWGAEFMGYNDWHDWRPGWGRVSFTKMASGTLSVDGLAFSPLLENVDVYSYPLLAVDVYTYILRDITNGNHCKLDIGVTDGLTTTWLMTDIVDSNVDSQKGYTFPYEFTLCLPGSWTGTKDFTVTFRLKPYTDNGYSASFELDEVAVRSIFGDFNGDREVTVTDIMMVANRWRCRCGDACYDPLYDLDGNSKINIVDIMKVAAHWGESYP